MTSNNKTPLFALSLKDHVAGLNANENFVQIRRQAIGVKMKRIPAYNVKITDTLRDATVDEIAKELHVVWSPSRQQFIFNGKPLSRDDQFLHRAIRNIETNPGNSEGKWWIRAQDGLPTAKPAYGYEMGPGDRTCSIDPDLGAVIAHAFALAAERYSYAAEYLNDQKIMRPNGRLWDSNSA